MNIILSIKPKWAEKIYSGEKKIEWRKTCPSTVNEGAKVYIYETAPICKVTGRFTYIGSTKVDAKNLDLSYEFTYDSICVRAGCVKPEDLLKLCPPKVLLTDKNDQNWLKQHLTHRPPKLLYLY